MTRLAHARRLAAGGVVGDALHEDHVPQAAGDGGRVFEGAAAQFHNDVPVAELADPAEGFGENPGFLDGVVHVASLRMDKKCRPNGRF